MGCLPETISGYDGRASSSLHSHGEPDAVNMPLLTIGAGEVLSIIRLDDDGAASETCVLHIEPALSSGLIWCLGKVDKMA